jgi:hypothetical protein
VRTDGRTDRYDEAISRFRNFANAPKKRCTESRRTAPPFLKLYTARKGKVHAPVTLPPRKALPESIGLGPSAVRDTLQMEKILFPFPGKKAQFLGCQFLNAATVMTELPRLPLKNLSYFTLNHVFHH